MNNVGDVVWINRNIFMAWPTCAWINLSCDLDFHCIQWHMVQGGLNEKNMCQTASQDSQLQFRRSRTKIIPGKIWSAVADDLKVTNTDTPYPAATFRSYCGLERMWSGASGFGLFV